MGEIVASKDLDDAPDYLVLTDFSLVRARRDPVRYEGVIEAYRRLFSGQTSYRLAATFDRDTAVYPSDWVYARAEPTFYLFDHPRLYLFARQSGASNHN